jgi:single-strand DNA-binding protein
MSTVDTTLTSSPESEPLMTDASVTLVVGTLSRAAEIRVLPSGDTLVGLEVTARRPDGTAESMPVSWPDAPTWAGRLNAGERVVVVGRVRRRFYRAGGVTASRTEIIADRVEPVRQRVRSVRLAHRARSLIDAAVAGLESASR